MVDEAQLPAVVVIGAPHLEPRGSLYVLRCMEPACGAKHRVTAKTEQTVRQLRTGPNPPVVVCYSCYLKGLVAAPDLPPGTETTVDELRTIHGLPEA